MKRSLAPCVMMVILVICAVNSVSAADYYVNVSGGPGSHSGTMEDPFKFLNDAMAVAVAGDVPAAGVFPPDMYTTRTDEEDDTGIVDLRFHYRSASGVTPTPTNTPTPSPTMTATFTPTPPTWTPTATPTLSEHPIHIDLEMPKTEYHPGDLCYCRLTITNIAGASYSDMPLFVILDVAGTLLFAPSFTGYDYYREVLPPGETLIEVLPEFEWPHHCGSMSGVWFYAAVTDSDVQYLVSNLETVRFGWNE